MPIYEQLSNALAEASANALTQAASFLPRLAVAVVILIAGVVIAALFRSATARVIRLTRLEGYLEKTAFAQALKKGGAPIFSDLTAEIVRWFVLIVFLLPAVDVLGLSAVRGVLNGIILYIPNVFVAAIILMLATVVGEFVRSLVVGGVGSLGSGMSRTLGGVSYWAVFLFGVLAALTQLGIAPDLMRILFAGFVSMLAIAGGIAFGLGGVDTAKDFLAGLRRELRK